MTVVNKKTATTTFQFFWKNRAIHKGFRAGVSLHSHTMYSEESLEMIPRYTAKVPYLGSAIRRQQKESVRSQGVGLDFGRAFWTPPLAPRQAHRLEEKQIQSQFQLPGIISLTDHDDSRAGTALQVLERFRGTPVSSEWTIPFGPTFFHLGVHNIPAADRVAIMEQLSLFTDDPLEHRLGELLNMLNSYSNILLVLNHPLWDEKGIGIQRHAQVLGRLLERHGRSFHALELNGLRSWHENQQVIWLGRQGDLPLISGGDRHGLEPNAILNLSQADNIADFVAEVRYRRTSHVVFMPQYHEPLKLRILQTMVDVVRDYPEAFEGRRTWADRVFFKGPDEAEPLPMRTVWKDGGPKIVHRFITAMRLLEWRGVRSALRLCLHDRHSVWSDLEAAI
jgi:hypothetical protein